MGPRSAALNQAINDLQRFIEATTGATLPIVPGKITPPAIVKSYPDSIREYTRMNTTFAKPSNNLTDFATLKFVE